MGLVQSLGSAVSTVTQASISLTLTAATTAGNTLVVSAIQASANGFTTVTDAKGNAYVKAKQTSVGTSQTIASFVAVGAAALSVGDTITLTSAVSNQYPVLVAYEFTPVTASDASTSATDSGTSSSTYSIPGVAVPAGDHLLIGVLGATGASRSQTPSGTWQKLGTAGDAAPTFSRTVMSMWDQQTAGTLAASGTFSASVRWCGHLLAFPVASSSSTQAASGVSGVVSALTGTAAALLLTAGTITGTAGTTGDATVVRAPQAAAGTVTATTTATGAATGLRPAQATTAVQSGTQGTATALLLAGGTAPATASASGAPTVVGGPATLPAAGTLPAATTTAGTVTYRAVTSGATTAATGTDGAPTLLTQATGTTSADTTTSGAPIVAGTERDITVTATIARRWAGHLEAPTRTGALAPRRWAASHGDRTTTGRTGPRRWTGALP